MTYEFFISRKGHVGVTRIGTAWSLDQLSESLATVYHTLRAALPDNHAFSAFIENYGALYMNMLDGSVISATVYIDHDIYTPDMMVKPKVTTTCTVTAQ